MHDLFLLLRTGSLREVEKALLSDDINRENEFGENLLHEAILTRKPDIALALIARGINVNKGDHETTTSLHLCASKKPFDVARAILKGGGDVTIQNSHGNQPLWTAVFNARVDYRLVKALLEAGADPNHKNKYAKSPLDFAVTIGSSELQKILTAY